MGHAYKTLRVGDTVSTPYGLGTVTRLRTETVIVHFNEGEGAGGHAEIHRDNVHPVIVMNPGKTVALSQEFRDTPEWVLDAASAIERYMDDRLQASGNDHWIIGGIEKRRPDYTGSDMSFDPDKVPPASGSRWRTKDGSKIEVCTVTSTHSGIRTHQDTQVVVEWPDGMTQWYDLKKFYAEFRPEPEHIGPFKLTIQGGRITGYERVSNAAPAQFKAPEVGSRWLRKIDNSGATVELRSGDNVYYRYDSGVRSRMPLHMFERAFTPDTTPSTADVPDDELREQLAACRDDWTKLCDVVSGGRGTHYDPEEVVDKIAQMQRALAGIRSALQEVSR